MASVIFSELDVAEGFNQLRIAKLLQEIFTFSSSREKVSLKVLPFGVFWASSIFQASVDLLLRCLQIYIDNLGIHSMSGREHFIHLREETLQICKDANLHIRREKCTFMVTKINTLGFVISQNTLEPDNKIDMLLKARLRVTKLHSEHSSLCSSISEKCWYIYLMCAILFSD